MHPAIETLMTEHRLIEQVLGSFEAFASNLQNEAEASRQTVTDYADFFRNFADTCHHGKEEERLFTTMTEFGFPREFGPIAVMLSEHAEGRAHVKALAEIGERHGALSGAERAAVIEHARAYVPLLRAHIVKEDNILYPMAAQTIPEDRMNALGASFEAFEQDVMGGGTHEAFHALAERLVDQYPPDPASMNAGSACAGCAGHM